MARTEPFDRRPLDYDDWFDKNRAAYLSELRAVESLLPEFSRGLEIGVGSGRFASALGIEYGLEPSGPMAALARKKGIKVCSGAAEAVPFADGTFDLALMVTVLCFVDNVERALREAKRILMDRGILVAAFLDRDTELGRIYSQRKPDSYFYRKADFISYAEMAEALEAAGFSRSEEVQTIFEEPAGMGEISNPKPGHGRGLFVAIKCEKR